MHCCLNDNVVDHSEETEMIMTVYISHSRHSTCAILMSWHRSAVGSSLTRSTTHDKGGAVQLNYG